MDVNNEGEDGGDEQPQQDQQGEDATVDDDNGDAERHTGRDDTQRQKKREILNSILDHSDLFPLRQRNYINVLVDTFVDNLKDDIHEMITDQQQDDGSNNYRGLDSERDTLAEVEFALRFFPENLSRKKSKYWCPISLEWIDKNEDNQYECEYPIHCLTYCVDDMRYYPFPNLKATPFVHLFAKLATEFKSFEQYENDGNESKGGLLLTKYDINYGFNTFYYLTQNFKILDKDERERCRLHRDNVIVAEFIRLRRIGLFTKEDIQNSQLVKKLIVNRCRFERTLRFVIEWDPSSLVRTDVLGQYRWTPLHLASRVASIEQFIVIFEYLIRYYPTKKGICTLFQQGMPGNKPKNRKSPYEFACERLNRPTRRNEKQTDVRPGRKTQTFVEEILARYSNTTPINIPQALVLAATDEKIDLSCTYFLLRREPGVLIDRTMKKKSSRISVGGNNTNNTNSNKDNENGGHHDRETPPRIVDGTNKIDGTGS